MTAREGTIPIISVTGKTYSLFGNEPKTESYYRKISTLADRVLGKSPDILDLVKALERASRNKRFLKKQLRTSGTPGNELIHFVVTAAHDLLTPHTALVNAHLQELSFLKRWDGTLFTSEEQYHLYMLLVELANRAWKESFRAAKRKIAFLPYCLRDLGAHCRSGPGELDYVCRACSKNCFVNRVSALLRENRIEPYLWMNASLKSLLKGLRDREGSIGVLGVACIPELMRGMRLCIGLNVPVVGIPLNANRCMRWMGAFHPTSVDLEALNKLVGDSCGYQKGAL